MERRKKAPGGDNRREDKGNLYRKKPPQKPPQTNNTQPPQPENPNSEEERNITPQKSFPVGSKMVAGQPTAVCSWGSLAKKHDQAQEGGGDDCCLRIKRKKRRREGNKRMGKGGGGETGRIISREKIEIIAGQIKEEGRKRNWGKARARREQKEKICWG